MSIPASIRQGDSANWFDDPYTDASGKRYDSSAYTLTTIIAGPIPAPISLVATANGLGWKTALDTTTSATLVAGQYWWECVLTRTGERVTIGTGELQVLTNLALAGANYDGRTLAEKALSDAEAALANFRASHGRTKQYTIGSRTMQFDSAAEILQEISYWRIRVDNERSASLIAQGLGNPRKLFVRFR